MKMGWMMLALAAMPAVSAPAVAQSYAEQRRWEAAQARYDSETRIYERERALYDRARARSGGGYYTPAPPPSAYAPTPGYYAPPPPAYDAAPPPGAYVTEYDAARDYRDDPRYEERVLSSNDQVYRGSDGRYYCKRNDGTTGLIIGGAGGAVLGNVIDGGRNRVAGTLNGGALGAILGKKVDQNQQDVRCR